MANNPITSNRVSSWDDNRSSSIHNTTRPVQNGPPISLSPSQYVVPYSRYNSIQPSSQLGLDTQQHQQPNLSIQSLGIYQPIQTNTPVKSEPTWCAKHISINRVLGLFIGLVAAGIPLAVMVTLYVQLNTTSSDNTATSISTTTISPVTPFQCTSSGYTSWTDYTRLNTYMCNGCYCDYFFGNGWYRIQGAAGTRLATMPPAQNYCGTNYPVWFNGTLPSNLYDISIGTGCMFIYNNLCYPSYSTTVLVTNCGSFYVYYLQSLGCCTYCSRYCTTF